MHLRFFLFFFKLTGLQCSFRLVSVVNTRKNSLITIFLKLSGNTLKAAGPRADKVRSPLVLTRGPLGGACAALTAWCACAGFPALSFPEVLRCEVNGSNWSCSLDVLRSCAASLLEGTPAVPRGQSEMNLGVKRGGSDARGRGRALQPDPTQSRKKCPGPRLHH